MLSPELTTVPISFHSGAFVFTGICAPNVWLYNISPSSPIILTPRAGSGYPVALKRFKIQAVNK